MRLQPKVVRCVCHQVQHSECIQDLVLVSLLHHTAPELIELRVLSVQVQYNVMALSLVEGTNYLYSYI